MRDCAEFIDEAGDAQQKNATAPDRLRSLLVPSLLPIERPAKLEQLWRTRIGSSLLCIARACVRECHE
jgi:hypothetical protein